MATRGTTGAVNASLDFAFFHVLWSFYTDNRGRIRTHYKELTRRFLDFNDPKLNSTAFLRQPQFEALEVYVFLKEFLGNAKVEEVFQQWFGKTGHFAGRTEGGIASGNVAQASLFDKITQDQYKALFTAMRKNSRTYPNYIFALTMGTGKTILMATCVFYEFLLGNKFKKDTRYCHNALIFAPDRTVLHSLREIESLDPAHVVPPEYVNFLRTHLRFHYLEEAGTTLNTLDRSRFNIIVSNTQKIILKRQNREKPAVVALFETSPPPSDDAKHAEVPSDLSLPQEQGELATNQRFEKLRRLEQLGIYVDEAHHAFGKALAKDMGVGARETDTSLRTTIDILAASLYAAGTRVVACYNYTGTPYVGREVLPEVVYAYGLKEAIDHGFLKNVTIYGYANTRSDEFVDIAIDRFIEESGNLRPEGLTPKLAFFAATIEELTRDLRPAVERALIKRDISTSRILLNVGDNRLTTNDDIREFNRLDTPESEKQFILLVNKGREGWNCRSLFGVALFREPKSKVFVLQATMRCLRSIGGAPHTGHVFLSESNLKTLNEELLQNFRISAVDLQSTGKNKERVTVRVTEPPVTIKLVRIRKQHQLRRKTLTTGHQLIPEASNTQTWGVLVEKYRLIETSQEGLVGGSARASSSRTFDLTSRRKKRTFSRLTLVAEVSRYLNMNPLEIEDLLSATKEGCGGLVAIANEFNELLYDEIIPRLFRQLYDLDESRQTEEHDVELIKIPPGGYYEVSADSGKIVRMNDPQITSEDRSKSFHLDTYCFDSGSENQLFWDLLREKRVKKLYFTGMLTHGQSDFFIQYIDPDSRNVRSYYPDFIFQREESNGTLKYVIVEVKADNQIEDSIVQAKKDFAQQIAVASGMEYHILKSSDADRRRYRVLL